MPVENEIFWTEETTHGVVRVEKTTEEATPYAGQNIQVGAWLSLCTNERMRVKAGYRLHADLK